MSRISTKLSILPVILLSYLNGFHHLPVASTSTPSWRALIRLDPSSEDDIASDVVLTGWHSCSTSTNKKEDNTNNCRRHFGAEPLKLPADGSPLGVDANGCVCMCPPSKPVFLYASNNDGRCVDKLEDCQKAVLFKKESEVSRIPLVLSPKQESDEPILPVKWVVMWKESSIKVRPNVGVRCGASKVSYLGGEAMDWQEGEVHWIRFGWANNTAQVFWNLSQNADSKSISKALTTSILRVDIQCQKGSNSHQYCMAFRLAGQLMVGGDPSVADIESSSRAARPIASQTHQPQGRLETILIILLAILLFLSVFGSIVLWNVCWRLKKSELISALQMQFLYHIKQEKEKAADAAQHRYQMGATKTPANGVARPQFAQPRPYPPNGSGSGVYGEDLEDASVAGPAEADPHNYGLGQQQDNQRRQQELADGGFGHQQLGGPPAKRKLYFSAEFFEPHLMANPPQMAEQFLFDLRKMIAITKQRLLLRSRHTPRLSVIPEEDAEQQFPSHNYAYYSTEEEEEEGVDGEFEDLEGHQVHMEGHHQTSKSPLPPPCSQSQECEGSPKSVKSGCGGGDSGVVSSESNSDCSTSSQSPPNTPPTTGLTNSSGVKRVRQIVKGFESPPPIKTSASPSSLLAVPCAAAGRRAQQACSNSQRPPSSYFQSGSAAPATNGSRIPVSKSPRLTPKSLSLAQPLSINANVGGSPMGGSALAGVIQQHSQANCPPLPPRNTAPPPPPSQPPPPIPSTTIGEHANAMLMVAAANQQQQKNRLAAQKRTTGSTYAVFPSDSLKKSLPRRSKKAMAEARANILSTSPQPHRTVQNGKGVKTLIETKM